MRRRKDQRQQQQRSKLSRVDQETLLPLSKDMLIVRLLNAYSQIDRLYEERDLLLLLLSLLAQNLHLWNGITRSPEPSMGWHYVLVIDLPAGQVWWPIADDHLPLFRDVPIYPLLAQRMTPEERVRRLHASGLHLLTEDERTEPMKTYDINTRSTPLPL